ncbi:META domain-containing protein [Aliiruegeria haliotis]|uniref:META domain-containing protein n=2 Tax=Aliiruegeria haliotis TaxID=1280846 RepID=A0A2T0RJF2_9RHOB|nr:META domain-containing protein [Aliiruegeria haliotis]
MSNWGASALLFVPLVVAFVGPVKSDADGPDNFSVIDVAADDVLNLRTGPSAEHPQIGELPHDAGGVANLGCIGGLTFEEWSEASNEVREAGLSKEWCLVGFDRLVGWSSGRYLGEGSYEDGFRAGAILCDLQGSEWRATGIGERPVDEELIVRFGSDGRLGGSGGCSQMTGSFERDRDEISIGPIATTRKF